MNYTRLSIKNFLLFGQEKECRDTVKMQVAMEKIRTLSLQYHYDSIIALVSVGLLCFFYSLYKANFAELHVELPFLDFPVFIGEIGLIASLMLLFLRGLRSIRSIEVNVVQFLIVLFFVFILGKAFLGYSKWGPLAFRNAALFYYSFFAIISYHFFDISLFRDKLLQYSLLGLFLSIIFLDLPKASVFFYFNYCIFAILLLLGVKERILRAALVGVVILFSWRHVMLFTHHTEILLSNAISYLMLCALYLLCFVNVRLRYRIIACCLSILLVTVIFYNLNNMNTLKSILNFDEHRIVYRHRLKTVNNSEDFRVSSMVSRLYYPEDEKAVFYTQAGEQPYRDLNTIRGNIIWRIIVWKDMLKELLDSGKPFGLDFGKPFKPQILGSARMPAYWTGWIEPYNSWLHILYRAGIVGLFFTCTIWVVLFNMVYRFVKSHNIKGVLLGLSLFYWLFISGTLVILELPYFAIPFWSLFGITYGYYNEKR